MVDHGSLSPHKTLHRSHTVPDPAGVLSLLARHLLQPVLPLHVDQGQLQGWLGEGPGDQKEILHCEETRS